MTKYFSFNGVATRQEFWAVQLIAMAIGFVLGIILGVAAGEVTAVVLVIGVFLALTWLSLATIVRRLRDAGLNTWWVLATLIPYVGFIAMIAFGIIGTKTDTVAVEA